MAAISPTPGFERGRYDVHVSLAETTLYDGSHRPTRNYKGTLVLQGIRLPTDDFRELAEREFRDAADGQSSAAIEFNQVARRDERPQRPFGQRYPVVLDAIRFGRLDRHALQAEIAFRVDFAAGGPPNPWADMAAVNPYQLARMKVASSDSGYPEKEWEAFRALVEETEAAWRHARYSTNVRVLLNHRGQSSAGMNNHER